MKDEFSNGYREVVQSCPAGSNPPCVEAWPCGEQVRVSCPYCGRDHYHGAATLGHRLAHCGAGVDYILTVPTKLERRR